MSELARFQDAFIAALQGDASDLEGWLQDRDSPGLAVYRNTVRSGAIDALASIFHTVQLMVGVDWFRAAASEFAAGRPPAHPSMLNYGQDFPKWLTAFPPAADTPYLGSLAQMDWLWWEAHFAAEADRISGEAIQALQECDLAQCTLKLHPAVRFARFNQTLASLWLSHQRPDPAASGFAIEDRPEHVLFTREQQSVRTVLIDGSTYDFLSACAEGASLLDAASRAMGDGTIASLPGVLWTGLEAGAFAGIKHLNGGGLS